MRPWLGDSIGWWEGETLCEDKNHHPQQKFRAAIRHQILMMKVPKSAERFTRTSENKFFMNSRLMTSISRYLEGRYQTTNEKIYE